MYLHRNHSSPTSAAAGLGSLARGLAFALGLLASTAFGQALTADIPQVVQAADDPGRFEVRSASVELDNGVYFLNARIEYRLSSDARDALKAGVPLNIRIDVEIMRSRRFWFDNTEAELRQRYALEYHALSERYIVMNVE